MDLRVRRSTTVQPWLVAGGSLVPVAPSALEDTTDTTDTTDRGSFLSGVQIALWRTRPDPILYNRYIAYVGRKKG